MRSRSAAWLCSGILTALAAGCLLLRLHVSRRAPAEAGETAWRITWSVRAPGVRPGDRIRVFLPDNTAGVSIVREEFVRRGLSMDVVRSKRHRNREAVCAPLRASPPPELTVTFDVVAAHPSLSSPPIPLVGSGPAGYLSQTGNIPTGHPLVVDTLREVRVGTESTQQLVGQIGRYCTHVLDVEDGHDSADVLSAIRDGVTGPVGRARVFVALCRAARVPARPVGGLCLDPGIGVPSAVWAEAWVGGAWEANHFDADGVAPGRLHLPVRIGGASLARATGRARAVSEFTVERLVEVPEVGDTIPHGVPGRAGRRLFRHVLNFRRLPPSMQTTLSLLLILPFGALVTALFRNVIGVQTFGTFTPSLIALTFTYADWRTGTVILLGILVVGIVGRRLLNGLHLLMVPRLGVVLTMAVIFLAVAVSLADLFGLAPSARVVILPTVILTMIIERFHVNAEEMGLRMALSRLGWTFLVAACCWAIFTRPPLTRLVLAFPETLLVVAAALVLVGSYSGYRLVELRRFRDLAQIGSGG